jgi:hypothetical protein
MLTNYRREVLTMTKAMVLGVAEEISERLVDAVNAEKTININPSTKRTANNKLYFKLLKDKLGHSDNQAKGLIEPLLKKFRMSSRTKTLTN